MEGLMQMRALILITSLAGGTTAFGDISGFADFSQFRINQGDGAAAPGLGDGWIRLTSNTDEQRRSILHTTRQDISQFTASFTYRAIGSHNVSNFGACLVFQNNADGVRALGGTPLGYGGMTRSVATSLETGQHGFNATGVYRNGVVAGGAASVAPIDFLSGHDIDVTVS